MSGTMKVAQISTAGGYFEVVERPLPEPGSAQVRVKVEACGICHSDVLVKDGLWPGLQYPRVPSHEIAGRIDGVGAGVTGWTEGQRVGVGWHGGHCFSCEYCRRGDFAMCINRKVTGVDFDGGYAEYLIAPAAALAAIPDDLPAVEAGPFMCASAGVGGPIADRRAHDVHCARRCVLVARRDNDRRRRPAGAPCRTVTVTVCESCERPLSRGSTPPLSIAVTGSACSGGREPHPLRRDQRGRDHEGQERVRRRVVERVRPG
jgi:Alcohol dehydrogenase GroES-like domain